MKIIKVVVADLLPYICAECRFSVYQAWQNDEGLIRSDMFCLAMDKILTEEDMDTRRPDWCPLVAGKIIPTIRKGYLLIKESEE